MMSNKISVNDEIFESRGFWFEWSGQGLLVQSTQFKEMKVVFPWEYLYQMTLTMEKEFGGKISRPSPKRSEETGQSVQTNEAGWGPAETEAASLIIKAFANQIATRITRTIIAEFQRTGGVLVCRDEFELNFWDEICIQAQRVDPHDDWHIYRRMIDISLDRCRWNSEDYEWDALMMQTQDEQSVFEYLTDEYIIPTASTWSNVRIQHFFDRVEVPPDEA